ncbi:phosphopantothenoylcysteine decarboxylase/phosphopantothenate--cysteine ligase [Salibacterium salarium]|uniref:bifunctional phosphopantothenoylcysteine decarboxylase/phosphopantothenate--cysteine ligase CoaBC n=1 Tax=Salibacterium salarium TaxID=284579 RepID=UPI002784A8D1|nr:bifunctional phosphopantothenoylcysteine decarboxylase/phosphopantothenate--cysteine ligase CoaBC [Salibacterium salarium]MDQ0299079.1 phosphopantothenoylcysteine decarboxylase/phosphopantothenate--cysteine ligase [Salibacterium salarium]
MLREKNILLGVTGGIAAYKAASLASKLTQTGANVKVMMTNHAKEFVTPLTFQALTRDRVYDDTFAETEPEKVAHIDIADWADMIVIAPATANMIAKAANGLADDMVSTTILAATCPVYIAPAMNVNMYEHPAVKENMNKLKLRGCHFIEPGAGYLACGWIGKGRLAEPEDITAFLQSEYEKKSAYLGKKILVTAGPTYEYSDPVRVFTNPSTGKMGFAVAAEAALLGAEVTLIAGPVQLETPPGVNRIDVTTAEQMYEAVMERFPAVDIVCKAAAVSDYRPVSTAMDKTKKRDGDLSIAMERTKDILAALGEKKEHQLLIGFAAESENVKDYANDKLHRKNLDMVVANNISSNNSGFGTNTNEIILLQKGEEPRSLPLLTKTAAAKELWDSMEFMVKRNDS